MVCCHRRDRARPHRRELKKMGEDKWGTRNCRVRALCRPWEPIDQGRHKARPFGDPLFVPGATLKFALMGLAPVREMVACAQRMDRNVPPTRGSGRGELCPYGFVGLFCWSQWVRPCLAVLSQGRSTPQDDVTGSVKACTLPSLEPM